MRQLRKQIHSAGPYFNRPNIHTNPLYNASSGHDASARNAGLTYLPTGVPQKLRHRKYLGMERRLGTIRL